MTDQEIRLECIKQAWQNCFELPDVFLVAKELADFAISGEIPERHKAFDKIAEQSSEKQNNNVQK